MIANTELISGETFSIQDNLHNKINEKSKRQGIRIVTEQARYPIDSIVTMLDSKRYRINPEYKRRKRWDNVRKSRLIESFIMNVPIPPIFLYEIEYSLYEVMDGQQRLTAIYDFYKCNFQLEGLEYWQELDGHNYQDLPIQIKKIIDRRYLSSVVLLQETAENSEEAEYIKKIVFQRLNSGGEELTTQEARNALYNGKFNQLCIKLSENEAFRKMWDLPLVSEGEEKLLQNESYRRMEDVELVLRFFAFRHIDNLKSPVDKFLDEYLKQANYYPDETIVNLEKLFNETIDLIYSIFGNSAFFLPQNDKRRYKLRSKTVYDAIMQAFANHIRYRDILIKNKNSIKDNLYINKDLLYIEDKNNRPLFDAKYNNKKDIEARINYFHNFLQSYI